MRALRPLTTISVMTLIAVAVVLFIMRPEAQAPPDSLAPAVLVGAGDIAECGSEADEATAALLDEIPGTVATFGDNAYPKGRFEDFENCYEPSWGRHKERTRPAPGNHDFGEARGAAYYDYFGAAAGEPGKGYYSYALGSWRIIVLNSECHRAGCERGSEQEEWLRTELARYRTRCTVAIFHEPRFSSGRYGNNADYEPFWDALYEHGAEIVLNGHEHFYERFAPQTPDGEADPERGIRQFTVGTGGGNLRGFEEVQSNSEVRASVWGVLKLTLHADRYEWEFVSVEGEDFTDAGSGSCH
jgi:acid phosphatase type 7